eukprot:TRINITY_DN21792_c0_g1_i2.p2 TRINITY_DN21792_c0_g1~~TRINITY_DN21792_c0_g1_i2.p2  ORF type:complete len:102 (+),score=7.99 TRINITY_DN21792_c0_g1_i2:59-364(+)
MCIRDRYNIGLGKFYLLQNQLRSAETYINRAIIALNSQNYTKGSPLLGDALFQLAKVRLSQNKKEDFEQLCQRALEIYREQFLESHSKIQEVIIYLDQQSQ